MAMMVGIVTLGTALLGLALGQISLGLPLLGVALGSGVLLSLRS